MDTTSGSLILIGGHEDREGERTILRAVAVRVDSRPLLLLSAASKVPEEYLDIYRDAFSDLGVQIVALDQNDPDAAQKVQGASGVFISGGDQNRFMESVPAELRQSIRDLWLSGGVIAGTSAGASVMSSVMLARGPAEETPDPDDVDLGEGLGLLGGAVVDQHFSERGRIGRLVAAVTQRRELLGIGIDEDTALIVERDRMLVLGAGSVYLLDVAAHEADPVEFRLRVLASGDAARHG